ncbi:BspR family type III secretion system anti-sigma factor [Diaphorobacter caeni]|uniref:hypothetical protein n=1 Tax=Diaphorobacter caeni TaxID=2784387 RepID=UPI001890893A|nr:hypothetical protein [Diaphorobacter caeni]MBF5005573.1 hypothetical protein [Diaphorobacter caeni]
MIDSLRPSIATPTDAHPTLDEFRNAAAQGNAVVMGHDGEQWKVLAQGHTPSQRSVAWVAPDVDTTSVFMDALSRSFSAGIQSNVARELGLSPTPGKPLSSRVVQQAIDMAETSQNALSGVDFFTQISCSASSNSSAFQRACAQLSISPADVDAQQRREIDAVMARQFENAAAHGQSPVSTKTAETWLTAALQSRS